MAERGVRIGAVRNATALKERVRISGLRVLSRDEAKEKGYQTKRTALVPTTPRMATEVELWPFTTEGADSRLHAVYVKVGERGLAVLEETRRMHDLQPFDYLPEDERPLVELIPGGGGISFWNQPCRA
ncbi:MAG: hypothetical protein ACR2LN_07640 [Candidatus Levyibacteriota bacterium]